MPLNFWPTLHPLFSLDEILENLPNNYRSELSTSFYRFWGPFLEISGDKNLFASSIVLLFFALFFSLYIDYVHNLHWSNENKH